MYRIYLLNNEIKLVSYRKDNNIGTNTFYATSISEKFIKCLLKHETKPLLIFIQNMNMHSHFWIHQTNVFFLKIVFHFAEIYHIFGKFPCIDMEKLYHIVCLVFYYKANYLNVQFSLYQFQSILLDINNKMNENNDKTSFYLVFTLQCEILAFRLPKRK